MPADDRKKRLHRLELIYVRSPIYFVTACKFHRRKVLASEAIHEAFVEFGLQGPMGGELRNHARSPTRVRCNGRSADNPFRLDEVFEKFDVETASAAEGDCASLAKNILRSSTAE
jgi:hypothetical protein